MITISAEGGNALEVLGLIKGFASLISADVPSVVGKAPDTAKLPENPAPAVTPANGILMNTPSNAATPAAAQIPAPLAGPMAPVPNAAQNVNVSPVSQQAPVNFPQWQASQIPAGSNAQMTMSNYPSNPVPQQQAPVASAPAFTYEQVGAAGAELVAGDPSKMPQAMALLQKYGVSQVTDLKPEQLAPFTLELRQLGAKI